MDAAFESLVSRFKTGKWTASNNILAAEIEPPGAVAHLPPPGSAPWRRLETKGLEALRQGQLGVVILAGGMATRFHWNKPKGIYPIFEGTSFLGWKLRWCRAICGDQVPVYIMTSFHTHEAIAAHLAEHDHFGYPPGRVSLFSQFRFGRLTVAGERFCSADGSENHASPGHGDFPLAMRSAGLLQSFLASGGTTLLFSNVDNLGATPDMAIVGSHLESGLQMTAEVAAKAAGDRGGAPARVNGRLQLVEGFAFPPAFDQDSIAYFNTATYCFDAQALAQEFDLPWYVVDKKVENQSVLQFEHLAGDLSCFLSFQALAVDRGDRFIPVKSQDDVESAQQLLARKATALQAAHLAR